MFERWYSSDLQMVVKSTRTDPRFGTTTYIMTNVQHAEPAAALFTVPSDYTVKEGGPKNRRGRLHGRHLFADRGEIVPRHRGHRSKPARDAARGGRSRKNDEHVGAHRRERLLDLRLGPRADGHHRDDGADADDDAERRQERAQLVAEDRAQGHAQCLEDVHAAPSR